MAVPEDRDRIREPRQRNDLTWLWVTLAVIALIIGGLILWALLAGEEEEPVPVEEESAGADIGVTLSEISEDPQQFVGQTVIVSGEINEPLLLDPAAFTIGGEEFFGLEEVLVVSAGEVVVPPNVDREQALAQDDLVQVRGVVQMFNLVEVEEELGVDLDDQLFAEFEGEAAIIADQIDVTARTPVEAGQIGEGATGEEGAAEGIAIGEDAELVQAFAEFEGQPVILRGEVAEVLTPAAFVTDDGLLVVDAEPIDALADDSPVFTTGVARAFGVAAFEEELGVDLDDEVFAEFEGEPAVVADTTVVLAQIGEIFADPEAFTGGAPTVLGEIEAILSENAFVLGESAGEGEDTADAGEEGLLVLNTAVGADLIEEGSALVTGEVIVFNLVEVEEELGVDLDDELFTEFEGQPAMVATAIEVIR